jgi:hypothetical protein
VGGIAILSEMNVPAIVDENVTNYQHPPAHFTNPCQSPTFRTPKPVTGSNYFATNVPE